MSHQKKKSDQLEITRRLRQVQEWILQSHTYVDIVKQSINTWGVCERTAKYYIAQAEKQWKDNEISDMKILRARAIQKRLKLARSMSEEEKKTARGIRTLLELEKDMDKLRGLYVDKHALTDTDGNELGLIEKLILQGAKIKTKE